MKKNKKTWIAVSAGAVLIAAIAVTYVFLQPPTMPLNIKFRGDMYTVHSFTVGTDESGCTTVTGTGSGYSKEIMGWPVRCSITGPDGTEYDRGIGKTRTEIRDGKVAAMYYTFQFHTSVTPTAVAFYAADAPEKKYTFDWKVNRDR